jgi:hypothetical protein
MNKHERRCKGATKQKRRIELFSNGLTRAVNPKTVYRLKTMSTPCSCDICSPSKRIETGLVKRSSKELQEARNEAYQYLIP